MASRKSLLAYSPRGTLPWTMTKPYSITIHSVFPDGQALEHEVVADAYILLSIQGNEAREEADGKVADIARLIGMTDGLMEGMKTAVRSDGTFFAIQRETQSTDEKNRAEEHRLREMADHLSSRHDELEKKREEYERKDARIIELEEALEHKRAVAELREKRIKDADAWIISLQKSHEAMAEELSRLEGLVAEGKKREEGLEARILVHEDMWSKLVNTATTLQAKKAKKKKKAN